MVIAILSLAGAAAASAGATAAADAQSAIWQHRQARFDYLGLTAPYTCDSLEHKVRRIQRFLGARGDLQVRAEGCAGGPENLTRTAWVKLDFHSLAIGAGGPDADRVQARWKHVQLTAQHPSFMEQGDCELIDQMHQIIVADFSWSGLDYQAACTPNELSWIDFRVRGEFLLPAR